MTREEAIDTLKNGLWWDRRRLDEAIDIAISALRPVSREQVEKVWHGRWIVHFDHFAPYQKCSVCGFEIPLVATENEGGMCLYKHCPECTACMDKEDEHES